jgi:hypothetical protein
MKSEIANIVPRAALVVGITAALLCGCATASPERAKRTPDELASKGHVVILVPVFIVVPPEDTSHKENSGPPLESAPL